MEDKEKEGEETSSRGTEWEVVSLTASAYAAAPGPKEINLPDETKEEEIKRSEQESSGAMFLSGHFIFPPSEQENLPLQHDSSEILLESQVQDVIPFEKELDAADKSQEDNQYVKSLSEVDEVHEIQFFGNQIIKSLSEIDEVHEIQFSGKGKRLNVSGIEFIEGKTPLQGLNLVKEDQDAYSGSGFSSFHTEIGDSISLDDNNDVAEVSDPSNQNVDSPSEFSKSPKPVKESKNNGSGLPCQAWWKRQAASLYAHAKETSTFYSLCVAAALMGLVILKRQWQHERWQIQPLKLQFSMNDEKVKRLFGPVSRIKDVLVGGHHRAPVIRGVAPVDL